MAPTLSAANPSVWYRPDYGARLKPSTRFVYNNWSAIPDEELPTHLHSIRNRAWPLGNYPCIGMWIFLLPGLAGFPEFDRLVARARGQSTSDGSMILDLGTGLGQDLRLLAAHGVPTTRMVAVDREPRLWQLGYELFRDANRMQARFIEGDFHTMPDAALAPVQGHVDLVIAAQFLHLFSRAGQQAACRRIAALSRPGTTVVGFQQGRRRPVEYVRPWGVTFYQNRESFVQMWEAVQAETGTRWEVVVREVELEEWGMEAEDVAWMEGVKFGIEFVITRVE
ncbi:S-adenosyl-L-methionine-dependent methyltransferase [Aspergillus indologenus CBS 114.80]|uniref:S-adenosyl-L-methionine-dependent methyltransferase n=1 Tax=Aspergillus indologenus CBS 114.80 TaxID=1450541 RepID=A0A2V5HYS2_9EURO|nr:S-adenosyl-L-methionine-dependent methyltransferase [Aspergillus indologenus CBS 114.80]